MLKWNVYNESFGFGGIKPFNVFDHSGFLDGCKKAAKKCGEDKAAFAEMVKRELMYYFWSKCEYEIVLTSWPPREDHEKKIDVYSQVMLNFDLFIDYLWGNIAFLRKRERRKR